MIWTGLGRTPNVRKDRPTIAVEFVSAGKRSVQRDYVQKRDEYLVAGLQEYWIIDRFRRRMTVYRREPNKVVEVLIREARSLHAPRCCPDSNCRWPSCCPSPTHWIRLTRMTSWVE